MVLLIRDNIRKGDRGMKIKCFFSEGCKSKERLVKNIKAAFIEEGIGAQILLKEMSREEAERSGIRGSPTVWVSGHDLEPGVPPGGIT